MDGIGMGGVKNYSQDFNKIKLLMNQNNLPNFGQKYLSLYMLELAY
jgi:hypothetical protein